MPGGIGPLELVVVLVVVLLVFGPKRLPGLGKQLGGGMREFKDSIAGKSQDDDDEAKEQRELSSAHAQDAAAHAKDAAGHAKEAVQAGVAAVKDHERS